MFFELKNFLYFKNFFERNFCLRNNKNCVRKKSLNGKQSLKYQTKTYVEQISAKKNNT